ncbi:hypothetical protein FRX31_030665 [Thalictrum thalictroides]|uniref:S-protein homolog n=1 Tax=Thalictrum thalictroides TaxID=46969 RepID=A0A7J6V502_THATH|nr:hypothetical protein FRX31_030665 [Thalictrum thalictroides]
MVSSFNHKYLGPLKLFLVLVALFGCSPICGKTHLFLRNEIRNNVTLSISCQNRDHDLGAHILGYKQEVEWILSIFKFYRIWCSASWMDNGVLIQGGFHVLDEKVESCPYMYDICIRAAKSDGVWAYNEDGVPHMIYRWPGKALEEEIKV